MIIRGSFYHQICSDCGVNIPFLYKGENCIPSNKTFALNCVQERIASLSRDCNWKYSSGQGLAWVGEPAGVTVTGSSKVTCTCMQVLGKSPKLSRKAWYQTLAHTLMALLVPASIHKLHVEENTPFPAAGRAVAGCRASRSCSRPCSVSWLRCACFSPQMAADPCAEQARPAVAMRAGARRRRWGEEQERTPWPCPAGPGAPALPTAAGDGWSSLAASLSLSAPGPWQGKGIAACLDSLFVALACFWFFSTLGRGFGISPDVVQLTGLFWLGTNSLLLYFPKVPETPKPVGQPRDYESSGFSLASSDSCSNFQHPLLDSLQSQGLEQVALFQALVVLLGREELCRVSLGSLCPSDPKAMLIFASPSKFVWLQSQREKHVNTPFS